MRRIEIVTAVCSAVVSFRKMGLADHRYPAQAVTLMRAVSMRTRGQAWLGGLGTSGDSYLPGSALEASGLQILEISGEH